MNSSNYAGRVCPLCGKQYTAPPALSRRDNATSICPECGTMEALDAMEERWCACSGHRSKDFSKLTDYYCKTILTMAAIIRAAFLPTAKILSLSCGKKWGFPHDNDVFGVLRDGAGQGAAHDPPLRKAAGAV